VAIKTRQEVREALGVLLNAGLVGTGLPVQAVYDYMKGTFDGQSPIVVVGSAGVEGEALTFQGSKATYFYEVLSFVAREGEEVAEDALDQVAQKLYQVIEANRKTGNWQWIGFAGRSKVVPAAVGGDPYWMEVLPVEVKVY